MRDDVLAGVLSSETGSTEDDEFIGTRRHDVADSHLNAWVQRRMLLVLLDS
jgi:hypothetical protein